MDKRIIFAGTPEFAAVHLKALLDAGIKPVAVYTQPDRQQEHPVVQQRQLAESGILQI